MDAYTTHSGETLHKGIRAYVSGSGSTLPKAIEAMFEHAKAQGYHPVGWGKMYVVAGVRHNGRRVEHGGERASQVIRQVATAAGAQIANSSEGKAVCRAFCDPSYAQSANHMEVDGLQVTVECLFKREDL